MSVKHAMLALLAAQPSSTYQLRKRFDASTGQSWPMNIGQVSSTLQRLERDGLVARDSAASTEAVGRAGEEPVERATESDTGGGQPWYLTEAGLAELTGWWSRPVASAQRGRDELVVKFALAVVTPGVDIVGLVQTQRAATQRTMHDLTRVRREVEAGELVARLILDHHLFAAEAELRWLDDVEAALVRAHRVGGGTGSDTTPAEAPRSTTATATAPAGGRRDAAANASER